MINIKETLKNWVAIPEPTKEKPNYALILTSTALEILIDEQIQKRNILKDVYAYVDYFYNNRLHSDKLNKLYFAIKENNFAFISGVIDETIDKLDNNTFFSMCKSRYCNEPSLSIDSDYCDVCVKRKQEPYQFAKAI